MGRTARQQARSEPPRGVATSPGNGRLCRCCQVASARASRSMAPLVLPGSTQAHDGVSLTEKAPVDIAITKSFSSRVEDPAID